MLSLFDVLVLTEEGRKEVKGWSAKSKAQIVLDILNQLRKILYRKVWYRFTKLLWPVKL